MKRIQQIRLDELIERHRIFMRSTNPKAAMESFAELIMDEMEKLNNGEPARLIQMVEDRAQSHNGPHLLTLELNQLAAWMRGKTWNGISPPNQMELKMVTCKKEPTKPAESESEAVRGLVEALEKLSLIGRTNRTQNSVGNDIAQKALAAHKEATKS